MDILLWSFVITMFVNERPSMETIHRFDTKLMCTTAYRISLPYVRDENAKREFKDRTVITECVKGQSA